MALTSQAKAHLVKQYQQKTDDTGSSAVQIALLSADINLLTEHFKQHPHDNHSKMGLLGKVSQRRRLMRYLKKIDLQGYQALIQKLNLRDRT